MIQRACRWLLTLAFLSFGLAMAQTEPTLNEVYATAQAGKLDQAQAMMQEVLILHPKSAKAHFVQSELFARQGNLLRARGALATAEELAPGLPFAKAEAVRALRAQLSTNRNSTARETPAVNHVSAADHPSSSWGLPLLLAGGLIFLGYLLFRNKRPAPYSQQPAMNPNASGLSGPQSFGTGGTGAAMQPSYGQAAGPGMGGNLMGGLATGLAVGAGVMAAQAIGHRLMGNPDQFSNSSDQLISRTNPNTAANSGMGGADFGVTDSNSWDDNSGSVVADSGSWDN